tara:strand:- start:6253 stop:7209 length:957 start_codon:yes stop_codon:yes gene_type:complete
MVGAALMDHWQRRVPNEWWIRWGVAIGFLLLVEVILLEADVALFLGTFGLLAWCSASVIGTPSLKDMREGSRIDILVVIWYLLGIIGGGAALYLHTPNALWSLGLATDAPMFQLTDMAAIELAESRGLLLLRLIGLAVGIGFIEIAWRARLLHGGADAKAMIVVALAIPWWIGIGPFGETTAVPPMVSVLIWSALAFLILPFVTISRNIRTGHSGPLRMIWHAERWGLDQIPGQQVWILSDIVETADGERKIRERMRPRRKRVDPEELAAHIERLKAAGETSAWITKKHPFLVYVLPAIPLALIIGDPVATVLHTVGI